MATYDKLIFPSTITRIIRHLSVPYLKSSLFTVMGAISAASVRRNEAQLRPKSPRIETATPLAPYAPSTSAPSSSSTGGVTLKVVMAQLKHMDALPNTLITELYQVNTRVSRITWRQAHMGCFAASLSPYPSPEASEDEHANDGFGDDDDDDDDDEDKDASSSGDEEMTTFQ